VSNYVRDDDDRAQTLREVIALRDKRIDELEAKLESLCPQICPDCGGETRLLTAPVYCPDENCAWATWTNRSN
jgi:hypothetical protein